MERTARVLQLLALLLCTACRSVPLPEPIAGPFDHLPDPPAVAAGGDSQLLEEARRRLAPLPSPFPDKELQVLLGEALFSDPRLSGDQERSCAGCHPLAGWVHAHPFPTGRKDEPLSPSLLNAGLPQVNFADGREGTLFDAVREAMQHPAMLASVWDEDLLSRLADVPLYSWALAETAPEGVEPVSAETIAAALTAFLGSLTTSDRLDRFLAGDVEALDFRQQVGLELFLGRDCAGCHQGALLGGGRVETAAGARKIPSLRNVLLSQPYLHDGRAATLPQAIAEMGPIGAQKKLGREEILAFLPLLAALTDSERLTGPAVEPPGASARADLEAGEQTFARFCSACHSGRPPGAEGREQHSVPLQSISGNDEALEPLSRFILQAMPPGGATPALSGEQAQDLALFLIRSTSAP